MRVANTQRAAHTGWTPSLTQPTMKPQNRSQKPPRSQERERPPVAVSRSGSHNKYRGHWAHLGAPTPLSLRGAPRERTSCVRSCYQNKTERRISLKLETARIARQNTTEVNSSSTIMGHSTKMGSHAYRSYLKHLRLSIYSCSSQCRKILCRLLR